MSQNKSALVFFMSLFLINSLDAMKRQREGDTQMMVVPQSKPYWDGVQPYDGSMVIKATLDHDCRHCNRRITDESILAHAFGKHPDIYPKFAPLQPTKKIKIQSLEFSSEMSSSSFESLQSSMEDSDFSIDIQKNNDLKNNDSGFVTKVWKNGHTVRHSVCGLEGCRFSSARSEEMDNHKKLHDVEKCLVCETCDFRAVSKRVFINHTQTHLPKEQRSNTVTCSVCNKILSKESSLKRHMESQHS